MQNPIVVKIIGAPIACEDGLKEAWKDVANWAAQRLHAKYGDQVDLHYFDLFDPKCPTLPPGSQLPVVFVNENLISSGGKISIPLIREKIEALVVKQ